MYTGPVHRPVYPYMHIPCIQALSGYGQDRPYTGLQTLERQPGSGHVHTGPERVWPGPLYTGLQYTLSAHAPGPVHTGSGYTRSGPAYHWRYRDPRTGLDTVANPRTNQWFVSAGGRMRAAAGAHYACACVYRRPHARGRYEGHEVISLPHPLPLSHGYIQW